MRIEFIAIAIKSIALNIKNQSEIGVVVVEYVHFKIKISSDQYIHIRFVVALRTSQILYNKMMLSSSI